jgi:hypothetical protein
LSPIGWEVVQLVGLQTLTLAILVRVQASQPIFLVKFREPSSCASIPNAPTNILKGGTEAARSGRFWLEKAEILDSRRAEMKEELYPSGA